MKILAILAHDKKESLNSFIFSKIIDYLKSKNSVKNNNIEIDILNLYDYADQIPFYTHDKTKLESNSFFQKNKSLILNADRLIIVHPIYWYSLPSILKAWVDLITNYAYKYESGNNAKALHKIEKVFVVNTSMAPAFYRKYFTCNPSKKQLLYTFRFIDIKNINFYEIGTVYKLDNIKVEKHIKNILEEIDKLV
ncbi:NAD(P)H-dependent oxidoreductase [Candidatus Dependentiae bacterium]|nr:NAD(P)H-dependent oxidoreductase [Candidatus Dependentiae bacterium]MCG2756160.1 NAD(P)H-dependent oxidoreductase [Candidatus Dependentiae bacterium]